MRFKHIIGQWLVLALLVGSGFSMAFANNQVTPRTVGGETVQSVEQYPWMSALLVNGKLLCGATLIDDRHLLTAAHCVTDPTGATLEDTSRYTVSVSDYDLAEDGESNEELIAIEQFIAHELFNRDTAEHDVAIIKLAREISVNTPKVSLADSTTFDQIVDNSDVIALGWGATNRNFLSPSFKSELNATQLTYLSGTSCDKKINDTKSIFGFFARFLGFLPYDAQNQTCTLNSNKGICSGDSGGPLLVRDGTQVKQIGITSFNYYICANPFLPAVYARTDSYRDWINHQVDPQTYPDSGLPETTANNNSLGNAFNWLLRLFGLG